MGQMNSDIRAAYTDTSDPLRVTAFFEGGGSRIAFHIGWLQEILKDGRVSFEAACGTSAGGIVSAVLTHGLAYEKTHGHKDHAYTLQKLDRLSDVITVCSGQDFFQYTAWGISRQFALYGRMLTAGWDHALGSKHILLSVLEETIGDTRYINGPHAGLLAVAAVKMTNDGGSLVLHHNRQDPQLNIAHIAATGAHTGMIGGITINGIKYVDGVEGGKVGRNPPIRDFVQQFGKPPGEVVLVSLASKAGDEARTEELLWLKSSGVKLHIVEPNFSLTQLTRGMDCIDYSHMKSMRECGRLQAIKFLHDRFDEPMSHPADTKQRRPASRVPHHALACR